MQPLITGDPYIFHPFHVAEQMETEADILRWREKYAKAKEILLVE